MVSGETIPGAGHPESMAQDLKAETARLWQAAQVEFGVPADSSAATRPPPPTENRDALITANNQERTRYVEQKKVRLNQILAADIRKKEGLGTARLSFADHFGPIYDGIGYDPREQGASKEKYVEESVNTARFFVSDGIFRARKLPDELEQSSIPHTYSQEDYQGILNQLHERLKFYIDFANAPLISSGVAGDPDVQVDTNFLGDLEYISAWREYFKDHPEQARAAGVRVGEDKRWQERINEAREKIIEGLAAKGAAKPAEEPESIQKARENLQTVLGWWRSAKQELNDPNLTLRKHAETLLKDELAGYTPEARDQRIGQEIAFSSVGTLRIDTKIFEGRVLPADPLWKEVHQEFQPEDEKAILNLIAIRVRALRNDQNELDPRDKNWLEAWEKHFERLARPVEEEELVLPPAPTVRENLQKDLQEISLVGTESVIPARRTYVEDFVKERARLNYQPLPQARIPEAINNWLRQAVVPVVLEILKDPQEGDADIIDQLGKLCSTREFDTIIGSVKQSLQQTDQG